MLAQRQTTIILPFPPSVNGLYDGGMRSKRRFKSARYRTWEKLADAEFSAKHPIPLRSPYIAGKYNAIYCYRRPDNRPRDVGNYSKALTDFLVSKNVITDDRYAQCEVHLWADHPAITEGRFSCVTPTEGVAVTITEGWIL